MHPTFSLYALCCALTDQLNATGAKTGFKMMTKWTPGNPVNALLLAFKDEGDASTHDFHSSLSIDVLLLLFET